MDSFRFSCLVTIHLRATGDAPILKRNKFNVSASSTFAVLAELLRKQLRFKESDSLVSGHFST